MGEQEVSTWGPLSTAYSGRNVYQIIDNSTLVHDKRGQEKEGNKGVQSAVQQDGGGRGNDRIAERRRQRGLLGETRLLCCIHMRVRFTLAPYVHNHQHLVWKMGRFQQYWTCESLGNWQRHATSN